MKAIAVSRIKTDILPGKEFQDASYTHQRAVFPLVSFFTMEGILLLAGALFTLCSHGFWLFGSLLEHLFTWPLVAQLSSGAPATFATVSTGTGTLLFIVTFALLFLLYLPAIRYLPRHISHRYVLLSALLLGAAYLLMPVVASQDIFSYVAYTRIGVIYHLNPLTTQPIAIRNDPIYPLLYWVNQPSAYGPAWTMLTCVLQWAALLFGFRHLLSMELLLRALGLAAHLASTQLIWSISGHLQRNKGYALSPSLYEQRRRATLAFAWNPFLLLEACINAHNDTIILFLILLALWLLLPRAEGTPQRYPLAAISLAIATCIKITFVVFLPALLLFLWTQSSTRASIGRRIAAIAAATGVYTGVIALLYAPFWQHGAILQILSVSPAMSHNVNSPYQFLADLFSSLQGVYIPGVLEPGSWVEAISHQMSIVIFAIIYGALCLRALAVPRCVNTLPALIRWMALVWLLYCIVGSPWFWPWYTITLFGLLALIETDGKANRYIPSFFRYFSVDGFARLLTLSMLMLYSFTKWQPDSGYFPLLPHLKSFYYTGYFPLLPHFRWDYFNGLWIWAIPFLIILAPLLQARLQKYTVRWRLRGLAAHASSSRKVLRIAADESNCDDCAEEKQAG